MIRNRNTRVSWFPEKYGVSPMKYFDSHDVIGCEYEWICRAISHEGTYFHDMIGCENKVWCEIKTVFSFWRRQNVGRQDIATTTRRQVLAACVRTAGPAPRPPATLSVADSPACPDPGHPLFPLPLFLVLCCGESSDYAGDFVKRTDLSARWLTCNPSPRPCGRAVGVSRWRGRERLVLRHGKFVVCF